MNQFKRMARDEMTNTNDGKAAAMRKGMRIAGFVTVLLLLPVLYGGYVVMFRGSWSYECADERGFSEFCNDLTIHNQSLLSASCRIEVSVPYASQPPPFVVETHNMQLSIYLNNRHGTLKFDKCYRYFVFFPIPCDFQATCTGISVDAQGILSASCLSRSLQPVHNRVDLNRMLGISHYGTITWICLNH